MQLPTSLPDDERTRLHLAIDIAAEAATGLKAHRATRGSSERTLEFKGRRELVTAADKASEQGLVDRIRDAFPDDAIEAEEGVATPAGRADRAALWCWTIDPLDGTTNFVHGHPSYSVSIGILRAGEPHLGVVHAPELGGVAGGECFYGAVGVGAWKNGQPIRVSATETLRDAVVGTGFSYIRNEPGVNTNLDNFGRVLMEVRGIRRCGSAALDVVYVAAGVYDAFWEMYLEPYDVAAGIAILRGAGGVATDLGSGAVSLRGQEILATNGRLTEELAALLTGRP